MSSGSDRGKSAQPFRRAWVGRSNTEDHTGAIPTARMHVCPPIQADSGSCPGRPFADMAQPIGPAYRDGDSLLYRGFGLSRAGIEPATHSLKGNGSYPVSK